MHIKTVIQAIPTHVTSRVVSNFPWVSLRKLEPWLTGWGQRREGKKIQWLNKKELVLLNQEGGMGFKDLQLFDRALLAKQLWRLLQNPSSLLCHFLKSKYFPHTNVLEATVRGNASYFWRSVFDTMSFLKSGLRWRVGIGSHINIWQDPWLSDYSTFFQSDNHASCSSSKCFGGVPY